MSKKKHLDKLKLAEYLDSNSQAIEDENIEEELEEEIKIRGSAFTPPKDRWKEYFSLLDSLRKTYPKCFPVLPVPLAVGMFEQMDNSNLERINPIFSRTKIRRFLNQYTRFALYKRGIVLGANRYNLDGSISSKVVAEEVANLSATSIEKAEIQELKIIEREEKRRNRGALLGSRKKKVEIEEKKAVEKVEEVAGDIHTKLEKSPEKKRSRVLVSKVEKVVPISKNRE